MLSQPVKHVAKKSFIYSFMLSQPFAIYADAYPALQNKLLLETEQIQYNDHGETVRTLQKKLNKLSYYDDKLDGDFGVFTELALKKFQADHNIMITGQADIETIQTIIQVEKNKYLKQIENLTESIYPGMHSEDVKLVQQALFYFGYYEGELDGIYGPLTKQALELAEETHNIQLTNKAIKESLTTLHDSEENKLEIELEQEEISEENNLVENKKEQIEAPKQVRVEKSNLSGVVQTARSLLGSPYAWGGTSPNGFDCSGFVQFVFESSGVTIPRTVSDIWNFSKLVDSPSVGDLVFFETYQPGPSHLGIYIGDNQFIHAGSSRGVEVSDLSTPYWNDRFLGGKKIN